ncbi:hypothetical protein C8J57DRAFT_989144, partial [Mycena rebaudengoi]
LSLPLSTMPTHRKGCLKTPPADAQVSKACLRLRKCVAFGEVLEEVHPADEWDRTPTEPARRLSYQSMLELKEIQQSLPRALQPEDPFSPSRQPAHILSTVPIGLLPLGLPSPSPSSSPVSPYSSTF